MRNYTTSPLTTTHIISMPFLWLCTVPLHCWRSECICGLYFASHQHFISCAWHSHTVECSSAYWADDGLSMHVYAIQPHEIERKIMCPHQLPSTYTLVTWRPPIFFFFLLFNVHYGEWRGEKKNIVLHEKRKRRRHFNFITILRAVYFPDKDTRVCVRGCVMISFCNKLWVGRKWIVRRIAFKSHHLPFLYAIRFMNSLVAMIRCTKKKNEKEMSHNNIQKIPDRR